MTDQELKLLIKFLHECHDGCLEDRMIIKNMSKKFVAGKIGMPYSTFCRHLANMRMFRIEEYLLLVNLLYTGNPEEDGCYVPRILLDLDDTTEG